MSIKLNCNACIRLHKVLQLLHIRLEGSSIVQHPAISLSIAVGRVDVVAAICGPISARTMCAWGATHRTILTQKFTCYSCYTALLSQSESISVCVLHASSYMKQTGHYVVYTCQWPLSCPSTICAYFSQLRTYTQGRAKKGTSEARTRQYLSSDDSA